MKEFPGLKVLIALLFPLLVGACAVDRPPTGGPPDNTPLGITASIPENGSVMSSPQTIQLDFSHYIGKEALQRSIHFSPSVDQFKVSVHGRKASIRLDSPLKRNRTYTLTLRNDLKSLYGNHRLGKSWALSFSTGPVIDNGSIVGHVWTPRMAPASNVTVMAWQGSNEGRSPDYLAQTGSSGAFRFEHLAPGSYRIVAITDKNGDLRYDPGTESFAVAESSAIAPDAQSAGQPVNLRLSDDKLTVALQLRSCRTINNREIEITLNRPIRSSMLTPNSLSIQNSDNGQALPLLACYSASRASESLSWRLLTSTMSAETAYRVRLSQNGSSSEMTFYGKQRDERYPALSVALLPANGAENVVAETIRPGSAPAAELHFNLPVLDSWLTSGALKLDLSEPNGGKRSVPYAVAMIDSRTYAIRPSGGFQPGRSYTLQVDVSKVKGVLDGATATAASTAAVASSHFQIAGNDMYGEINGSGTAPGMRRVVIEARLQDTAFVKRLETTPSAKGDKFSFSLAGLPAGRYVLSAFAPATSSSQWSAGAVEPFRPADLLATKTVEVRAGWSTDNVRLDLPANKQFAPQAK